MDTTIRYLNTDLDLSSSDDLTTLASALEAAGLLPLHVTQDADGQWHATFETDVEFTAPEPNIATMLAIVEALPRSLRSIWDGCARRELNIGYDCGGEPWPFNQGVSSELLGRMAAVGASLRVTLYPERPGDT